MQKYCFIKHEGKVICVAEGSELITEASVEATPAEFAEELLSALNAEAASEAQVE